MRAKLKPRKPTTAKRAGYPQGDGSVTIGGVRYEVGPIYDIDEKTYKSGLFNKVK